MNASILTLEDELESYREQGEQLKTQLEATTQELQSSTQESVSDHLRDRLSPLTSYCWMLDDLRSARDTFVLLLGHKMPINPRNTSTLRAQNTPNQFFFW